MLAAKTLAMNTLAMKTLATKTLAAKTLAAKTLAAKTLAAKTEYDEIKILSSFWTASGIKNSNFVKKYQIL